MCISAVHGRKCLVTQIDASKAFHYLEDYVHIFYNCLQCGKYFMGFLWAQSFPISLVHMEQLCKSLNLVA